MSRVSVVSNGSVINGNSNPWDFLGVDNMLKEDDKGLLALTKIAHDWYTLCLAVGAVGIVITVMYLGLRLMLTRDPRKRDEVKEALKWKIVIALVLFGIPTVLGVIFTLATALVP